VASEVRGVQVCDLLKRLRPCVQIIEIVNRCVSCKFFPDKPCHIIGNRPLGVTGVTPRYAFLKLAVLPRTGASDSIAHTVHAKRLPRLQHAPAADHLLRRAAENHDGDRRYTVAQLPHAVDGQVCRRELESSQLVRLRNGVTFPRNGSVFLRLNTDHLHFAESNRRDDRFKRVGGRNDKNQKCECPNNRCC